MRLNFSMNIGFTKDLVNFESMKSLLRFQTVIVSKEHSGQKIKSGNSSSLLQNNDMASEVLHRTAMPRCSMSAPSLASAKRNPNP